MTTLPTTPKRADIDYAVKSAIDSASDVESLVTLHGYLSDFAAMAREWRARLDEKFQEFIEQNGEVEVGDTRFYIGTTKKVRSKDDAAVLETLLDISGGDFAAVTKCLSANAWKPATARSLIGELTGDDAKAAAKYEELFETEVVKDLTTGKPRRGLKCVNTKFLNG